jgi:hypothetical protein
MRLAVRVTPRGGRDSADGWTHDEAGRPVLKLRVSAAATDGQANAAVTAFLAKALGVPKSAVRILRGESARVKQLEIDGTDAAAVAAVFGPPPDADRA